MSGEISLQGGDSSWSLGALVDGLDRSTVWNGSAFVAKSSLDDTEREAALVVLTSSVSAAPDSTDLADYVGDFPAGITTPGRYRLTFWDGAPIPANYIGREFHDVAGAAVTVSDITQAALAKFSSLDSGETTPVSGSIAKLAQGAAGGSVTVAGFEAAAIASLISGGVLGESSEFDGVPLSVLIPALVAIFAGVTDYDEATRVLQAYNRAADTVLATITGGTTPGNRATSVITGE